MSDLITNKRDSSNLNDDKVVWIIIPIKIKDLREIPSFYLEDVKVLMNNNETIKEIEHGKPKYKESKSCIVKQELCDEILSILKNVGEFLFSIAIEIIDVWLDGKSDNFEKSKLKVIDYYSETRTTMTIIEKNI